ncbi:MAG: molybdopterin-dependent oxidoreductase [Actinomycetes bacterium]
MKIARFARLGRRGVVSQSIMLTAVLTVAAACGGASTFDEPASPERPAKALPATRVSPVELRAGQPVPVPKKPVLTVKGKITTANDGDVLRLDTATLDRLGVLQVRMYEPWAKKTMSFRGVWLADLLELAGAAKSAERVRLTALDDYKVDLSMDEVDAGGIFLATQNGDGSPIPVDAGGPTRIVFVGGVTSGESADQWIWSLKDLDVR